MGNLSESNTKTIFPGEVFADTAQFDRGIRTLLPRYDEMLDAIARCAGTVLEPAAQNGTAKILELGCGTGELTRQLLSRYRQVEVVAVDYSARMLQTAQTKMAAEGYENRVRWIEADFGAWANGENEELTAAIGGGIHASVSTLAIHHLSDEMKQKLLGRICQSLQPGGCFFNADPTLPENDAVARLHESIREEWAASQGTTMEAVRAQIGNSQPYGYSGKDCLATLTDQLQMLKLAGFNPVTVPWKYYNLAIYGGFVPTR
jgi:trans-aconitate 2-methyltransferase|nr:class I SAM-dependent methyltransferase [Geitlerinema sp. PCC 9228]